jgi:hypothetical protein
MVPGRPVGLKEVTADRIHLVSEDGRVLDGDGQRHSDYPSTPRS